MARPLKDGVDYFPLNTNTDGDIKFQIIEARYGIVGYGIIIKIYQMIYGDKGYYCEWNELISAISASKWSCAEFPVTEKQVSRVVREAARYGIFDKAMLNKYGILTSKGIQKRYFEVSKRRSRVNVKGEYLLISVPETAVNVCKNGIMVNKSLENASNNTQSKLNERKVYKESNEKTATAVPALSEIKAFVSKEKLKINPEKFYYYYQNKKWKGISDWRAKACEWNATEVKKEENTSSYAAYDLEKFEELLNEED